MSGRTKDDISYGRVSEFAFPRPSARVVGESGLCFNKWPHCLVCGLAAQIQGARVVGLGFPGDFKISEFLYIVYKSFLTNKAKAINDIAIKFSNDPLKHVCQ